MKVFLIVNALVWGIPQILAILRFRYLQGGLANHLGTVDIDNGWSFGQILSVVVFLPVFQEIIYTYVVERPSGRPPEGQPGGSAEAATT